MPVTGLQRELIVFGTAVMFLTRLPVGRFCSADVATLSIATRYFPAVGLLIGGVLSTLLWLLAIVLPPALSVALILWAGVMLTGAFHEDGLADVADSAGAFGVDRKLEIMRDSRVGTYGALALILLILVKFVALWELMQVSVFTCVAALIGAHVLSRWSSVWMMATQNYARPEAANRVVAEGVDAKRLMHSSVCAVLLLLPVAATFSFAVFGLIPIAWLISVFSAYRYRRAYTGITGDCLGATNQLVEVGVYISFVAFVV